MKAVVAYQKKMNSLASVPKAVKLNKEMENKRKIIARSFSLAKDLYTTGRGNVMNPSKESELEVGARFLEVYIYYTTKQNIILLKIMNFLSIFPFLSYI